LTKAEKKFWKAEFALLDRLYKERTKEWKRLADIYDLKFTDRIRDLDDKDLIKISRFYPLVRQIIASIAFNYPKLFFALEEEEGEGMAEVMERASASLFQLMDVKPHVHQAIFDALFCGVGWLRVDYNPPGDDLIPPYVTNDAMHEDLTAITRVAPALVQVDPKCEPHRLGSAAYIREKMLMPVKSLKADDRIKNRNQIKPSALSRSETVAFGMSNDQSNTEGHEEKAVRESVENAEYVRVDRVHDRMNRKLIMFAEGVEEPILEIDHPFVKMSFPRQTDVFGETILDEEGQPIPVINDGTPVPGWLVEDGFPFIAVKFDLHSERFHPKPHLAYVDDIQMGIVESVSRQATLLKRTARQGLVAEQEVLNNPELLDDLRKGVDGQWHKVLDPNSLRELNYGNIPADQMNLEDRLRGYEEEITRVTDLEQGGATPRTATEASIIASQLSVNRDWMETAVARTYEKIIRNSFQVMGDPRYTPENFITNVAPDGQQSLTRALRGSDFMWNFRIQVVAGSTRPLFEQIEQDKFLNFYDRASQRPSFDQLELDKMLASSADMVDIDKIIKSDINPEAEAAARLENEVIIENQKDPGVQEGQDHRAHLKIHPEIRNHPALQQLLQQAQEVGLDGNPVRPESTEALQMVQQLLQEHMQGHEQLLEQEEMTVGAPQRSVGSNDSLQSTVRSNAQDLNNVLEGEAQEVS